MKKYAIVSIAFLCCLISCQRKHSPRIIELPYCTGKIGKCVLAENPPKDSLEMWKFFIKYYKQRPLSFYKNNEFHFNSVNFYLKNSTTSYFIDHISDPGGFSSNELGDYFYGWNPAYPRLGLGSLIANTSAQNSTEWIFCRNVYNHILDKWVFNDTLRDESKRGWYQQHRGNELVRLFNQGEPFPLDSIQTDTLASKKQMLNKPKARGKVGKRGTKN